MNWQFLLLSFPREHKNHLKLLCFNISKKKSVQPCCLSLLINVNVYGRLQLRERKSESCTAGLILIWANQLHSSLQHRGPFFNTSPTSKIHSIHHVKLSGDRNGRSYITIFNSCGLIVASCVNTTASIQLKTTIIRKYNEDCCQLFLNVPSWVDTERKPLIDQQFLSAPFLFDL